MPKYICTNKECKSLGEVKNTHGTSIRIINGEAIDINRKCPDCGELREVVRESGMTTMIAGTNDQRNRMARQ